MSSLYFPFDSLVQFSDFEDPSRSTTQSIGRRQNRQAGTMMGMPRLDLIEDQSNLIAIVECPGLKKDNIDISLHDNVLTISGTNSHHKEMKDQGSTFKISERHYGIFTRSFGVPPGLKENEIKAELNEGLLKVTMPKKAKDSEAKKITIG